MKPSETEEIVLNKRLSGNDGWLLDTGLPLTEADPVSAVYLVKLPFIYNF